MKTVLAVIALCISAVGQAAYLGAGSYSGAAAYGTSSGPGSTITAASCSQADFQAAINSAHDGDTVQGPASGGSATWSTQVRFTKGIILDGRGCNITLPSTSVNLDVTVVATYGLEIKNFTFNGATGNNDGQVIIRGLSLSTPTAACRIHNNTFNGDGEVTTVGHGRCLIDHNSFNSSVGGGQHLNIWGSGPGDFSTRKDDQLPGSDGFVFIEDNTFTNTNPSTYGQIQVYYGGSFVLRYNHLYNVGLETHGSSPGTCTGENGARWFEVYNNDHHPTAGITVPIKFRGGTGVVFGNTTTIADHVILDEDCPSGTWPQQGQVGQGINPNASSGDGIGYWSPLYAWGNTGFPVSISNSNFIQSGSTPYSCTHTANECDAVVMTSQPSTLLRCESQADITAGCPISFTYTPYTYPHPLTGGGSHSTYYVNNSGSPSCSDTSGQAGTLAAPFCTIDYGITRLASGDTLNIQAGTYTPNSGAGFIIIGGPAGTAGAPTTIQSYGAGTVTVTGASGGSGWRVRNTSYMNFSGLTLSGTEEGISVEGSNHITFSGMTVQNDQIACVHIKSCPVGDGPCSSEIPSSYVTFQNGTVQNCGLSTSLNGDGFYIATDGDAADTTNNITILNNTISNTGTECLNVKQYSNHVTFDHNTCDHNVTQNNGYSDAAIMLKAPTGGAAASGDIIRNNIISNFGPGSGGAYMNSAIRVQRNATIYNNVIYSANLTSLGYAFYTENSNTRLLYHNTVDAATSRFITIASGSAPTITNNIGPSPATYPNNLATLNSFYVNQPSHDYHLVAGSAPINGGVDLTATVPTDLDGVTRAVPPDMGAYEYTSAGCGPPAYSCFSTSTAPVPLSNPIPSWGANTCDNTSPYTLQTCGNLTGAGTIRTPSDFGNAIARLTDASTTNAAAVWGIVDNGENNLFASDDSWLIARINAGTRYVFWFNPSTMAGGLSGLTYPNIQLVADHTHSNTLYGLFGTSSTQIYQDTLPVPLASCAPSCTQPAGANHVLLYDFLNSGCLLNSSNGNPSFVANGWNSMFTSSGDDSTFVVSYGDQTSHAGTGSYVAVWKRSYGASGGCDIWNATTGAIRLHDGTLLTDSNTDTFYIHESWPSLGNDYAIVSVGSSQMINGTYVAGFYIWQLGTNNIVHCGAGAAYCDGHEANGYLHVVAGGKQGIHLYSNPNALAPPTTLIAIPNCDDNHESWNHDDTLDSFPVENSFQEVGSVYNLLGGATPPCTYYDEIDMAQTTPGTVNRAAHTFNSGWHWGFEQQNAIGVESSTGNFVMWPSDGWGQFGSSSGTASCNIGGPDWVKNDSADFVTGTGFGSYIMPQSSNSGHYIFQAQSCSGTCTTGSTEPAWGTVQTPAATITDNTITWVNTGNAYNCRSDILIVKLTR